MRHWLTAVSGGLSSAVSCKPLVPGPPLSVLLALSSLSASVVLSSFLLLCHSAFPLSVFASLFPSSIPLSVYSGFPLSFLCGVTVFHSLDSLQWIGRLSDLKLCWSDDETDVHREVIQRSWY